jgi:hypothetical protein
VLRAAQATRLSQNDEQPDVWPPPAPDALVVVELSAVLVVVEAPPAALVVVELLTALVVVEPPPAALVAPRAGELPQPGNTRARRGMLVAK